MLITLSWRNVWRNRSRSLVVIGSIIVGIWALIFMVGFMNGFVVSYINGAIKHEISHIQLHHPQFKQDYDIRFTIPDGLDLVNQLDTVSGIQAFAPRSATNGMISSTRKASGVRIYGVIPDMEGRVTGNDSLIMEGDYFQTRMRNPVVIGSKLAEELKVKIRSKIVLTAQDREKNLVAGAFRVVGILEASNPSVNAGTAYVQLKDLNKLLGFQDEIHEVAIFLEDPEEVPEIMNVLSELFPQTLVESWQTLAPELELFLSMTDSFLWVLMLIIMIALIFGIVNSMLMAVLERFRELGMLMAIGMNRNRIFGMIVIETIFLSLVGGPVGVFLGWSTMRWLGRVGIDLSDYSEGLREYGYESILYPSVEPSSYVYVTIGVVITALIGALYPALKAIKLNPTEALHSV